MPDALSSYVAPVLSWNAAHGWASFLKQGGRTGDWHPADSGRYLGELLAGQVGLATPFLFILFVCGMGRIARHPVAGPPGQTLLVFLTLPAVLVFVEHALGDGHQPRDIARQRDGEVQRDGDEHQQRRAEPGSLRGAMKNRRLQQFAQVPVTGTL